MRTNPYFRKAANQSLVVSVVIAVWVAFFEGSAFLWLAIGAYISMFFGSALLKTRADARREVEEAQATSYEHCMRLTFRLALDFEELLSLADLLDERLSKMNAGELDGNEYATDGSECSLYFYGNDAKFLYEAVNSDIGKPRHLSNADVYLRFGDVSDRDATEITFPFGSPPEWKQ
ncbi:MAG: hypothetical protein OXC60_00825 [Litoreibacter sp.]|nr:hypothetical protein [Litoreibacter sp.]